MRDPSNRNGFYGNNNNNANRGAYDQSYGNRNPSFGDGVASYGNNNNRYRSGLQREQEDEDKSDLGLKNLRTRRAPSDRATQVSICYIYVHTIAV